MRRLEMGGGKWVALSGGGGEKYKLPGCTFETRRVVIAIKVEFPAVDSYMSDGII